MNPPPPRLATSTPGRAPADPRSVEAQQIVEAWRTVAWTGQGATAALGREGAGGTTAPAPVREALAASPASAGPTPVAATEAGAGEVAAPAVVRSALTAAGPRISIVSPSFNQAAFVGRMLASVASQAGADFEHVVLDAGSTDGTATILARYAGQTDRAKVFVTPDAGQADAINKGFLYASGEVVTWLNTGDHYAHPNVLANVAEIFRADDAVDVVYGRGSLVDPDGRELREAFVNESPDQLFNKFFNSCGILQPALFFRKRLLDRAGLLDSFGTSAFEYEYWVRLVFAGARFRHCPEKLVHATFRGDAKPSALRLRQLWESFEVSRRFYGLGAVEWLERWSDALAFEQNGDGGAGRKIGPGSRAEVRKLFQALLPNANGGTAAALNAHFLRSVPASEPTRRGLQETIGPGPKRVIVTTFDANRFAQGCSLIASLQQAHGTDIPVIVFDLGMTEDHRNLLRDIEGVMVRPYPSYAQRAYRELLQPESHASRSIAFLAAMDLLPPGTLLLWIDAGVAVRRELGPIFDRIGSDEVFFVDHDDMPAWPFFNVTFTHPEAAAAVDATPGELLGPHICARMLGVRVGGRYTQLFRDVASYVLDRRAILWAKDAPQTGAAGEFTEIPPKTPALRRLAADPAKKAVATHAEVRQLGGYAGHRHDQAIFSIMAARYAAPVSSKKTYCMSTDAAPAASPQTGHAGAIREEPVTAEIAPEARDAITCHHSGAPPGRAPLIRRGAADRPLVLVGNGPSRKGFDFRNFAGHDTFGMNAAYRDWDEIGWYPTYYACLDPMVGTSHRAEIARLITGRGKYGIKLFFLRANLIDAMDAAPEHAHVIVNYDTLMADSSYFKAMPLTTGSHALLLGAALGYRRIKLVGVDCRQVELLPGVDKLGGTRLELRETPNDVFAGCQQKGDRDDGPNPTSDLHMNAWRAAARAVSRMGLSVVNCNPASALDCFPIMSWEEGMAEDARLRSVEGDRPRMPSVMPLDFARAASAQLDETAIVADMLSDRTGRRHVMLDIGAHRGGTTHPFRQRLDWTVHCFEPDAASPTQLQEAFGRDPVGTTDGRAVGDRAATSAPFLTSPGSVGTGTLSPVADSQVASAKVGVTTVAEIVARHGLKHIDFLRIDGPGQGRALLKGVPWGTLRPDVIAVEFEDSKTARPGHTHEGIADDLVKAGYAVYVSEWHPRTHSGAGAEWRRVMPYPCRQLADDAWGRLLAFRKAPGYLAVLNAFGRRVTTGQRPPAGVTAAPAAGPRLLSEEAAERGERRLSDYTADWRHLPGEPLEATRQIAMVGTDMGLALETREGLHILSLRRTIPIRPGGRLTVRHIGRLARPHSNTAARQAFLIVARLFDEADRLLGPHSIGSHPAGGDWADRTWVVPLDAIRRRFPAAARLRVSISHNWVDDSSIGNGGNGSSQTVLLDLLEEEPAAAVAEGK